jgi:hypothetical protein
MDQVPRRIRLGFSSGGDDEGREAAAPDQIDFVAYGGLHPVGSRPLNADRLSDMLNNHDEYLVSGLSVERFDEDTPFELDDEIAIPRDELYLVHAHGPRGDASSATGRCPSDSPSRWDRTREVLPRPARRRSGRCLRRRKAMVPLTDGHIEYTFHGQRRETWSRTDRQPRADRLGRGGPAVPGRVYGPRRLVTKPA